MVIAGCNNGTQAPDARIDQVDGAQPGQPDAPAPDAEETPDADETPDASSPFAGNFSIQEVSVMGHPELGQGLLFSFSATKGTRPPDYADGTILAGCSASAYDLDSGDVPEVTANFGKLTISGAVTAIPPCDYDATSGGYLCIGGYGSANGGALVKQTIGGIEVVVFNLTAAFTADDLGRYVKFTEPAAVDGGTPSPLFNSAIPIVLVIDNDNVVLGLPAAALPVATLPVPADVTYAKLAGMGPAPTVAGVDFLETPITLPDAGVTKRMLTVVLDDSTSDVAGDIPGFDFDVPVGGAFTLDDESKAAIVAIPRDGATLDIGCNGTNGDCGQYAAGSILVIDTTDADLTGASAYAFPAAEHKYVRIQCTGIGQPKITVPAAALAYLADSYSGATRIRTMFLRPGLAQPNANSKLVAGHGVVAFSDPQ